MLLVRDGDGTFGTNSSGYGRHECEEVSSLSVQQFVEIDFKRVRRDATDPTFRATCTGAMLSPAAMQDRLGDVPTTWPWCQDLRHWMHVVWQCDHRPEKFPLPDSPVKARFGWGAPPAQVNWMTKAAAAIWQSRFAAEATPGASAPFAAAVDFLRSFCSKSFSCH